LSIVSSVVALAALVGCTHHSAPRCGTPYLTSVAWVGVGGGIAYGWVETGGAAYYADDGSTWYDPDDTWDGTTDTPDNGDPPPPPDDPSGGWDTMQSARISFSSTGSTTPAPPAPDANGCWICTVGCIAGMGDHAVGRQAIGASDTSHDDACTAAVQTLAVWAHRTRGERLTRCEQMDAIPPSREPASPASPHPSRNELTAPAHRSPQF
jgi:hypothetical protein